MGISENFCKSSVVVSPICLFLQLFPRSQISFKGFYCQEITRVCLFCKKIGKELRNSSSITHSYKILRKVKFGEVRLWCNITFVYSVIVIAVERTPGKQKPYGKKCFGCFFPKEYLKIPFTQISAMIFLFYVLLRIMQLKGMFMHEIMMRKNSL